MLLKQANNFNIIKNIFFQTLWFGGNGQSLSIKGECSCPEGMYFNENEMECMKIGNNSVTIDVNEQSNPGRQLYTQSVNTTRRPELSRSLTSIGIL